MSGWAERAFFASLEGVVGGAVSVETPPGRARHFGAPSDLDATLVITAASNFAMFASAPHCCLCCASLPSQAYISH
mgnify:CR=1 FL=1